MKKNNISIEELRKIEASIPDGKQMYFDEAIMIMRNETEKVCMMSLAYALGFMRGQETSK